MLVAVNVVVPAAVAVVVYPSCILSIIGNVNVLFVSVLVEETVGTTTPSTARTPADERDNVVSVACPNSILPTPSAVEVDAVIPLTGRPVQLVNVPELGVPRTGVVSVGLVNVLLVKVSVVALPTKVSLASGKSIVLSAVGSTVDNVVSKPSAVAPSNTKAF